MKLKIVSFSIPVYIKTVRGIIRKREGFYCTVQDQTSSVITEISPLPYWSKETLDDIRNELQILSFPIKSSFSSVRFAMEAAFYRMKSLKTSSFDVCSYQDSEEEKPKAIKLKLFDMPLEKAIEFCQMMKKKYPKTELRLDINESWSLEEAFYFASHFHPEDFAYLEEPIKSLRDLETFTKEANFPVAIDEKLYKYKPEDLQRISCLKAVIVKPTLFGGISDCKRLQKFFDCALIFSSAYETEIGLANIHLHSRLFSPKTLAIGAGTLSCLQSSVPSER